MPTLPHTLSGLLLVTTALAALAGPASAQSQGSVGTTGAGAGQTGAQTGAGQTGTSTPVMGQDEQQEPEIPGQEPLEEEQDAGGAADPNEVEAVVVTGNIPLVIRETSEVSSVLTADDLARQGDDTAAGALTRVTGLSLVAGRFIYVRGLGERYSSALLNGSPLPSPEPLQRVVPLDLFPSSILANVLVQKTYSNNFPGEFGGGVIALTTVGIPNRSFLSVGASVGGNTETTLKDGLGYYGGDYDWLGYDDGTRDTPDQLKLALLRGRRIDGSSFTPDELANIGKSFTNARLNLLQNIQPEPNVGLDVSGGTSVDLGWGRAGVVAVLGYDNAWQTREGRQQSGEIDIDRLLPRQDFTFNSTQQNVDVNALLGFGLDLGDHELRFTNLYVRSTQKEARVRQGVDELAGGFFRDDFTEFFARTLFNHQLTGEHDLGRFSLNWRGAFAKATRDSPYEKVIRFERGADGLFRTGTGRTQNRTRFSEVEDQLISGGFDLGYDLDLGENREVQLTAGYAYFDNDRQFEQRDFRFQPPSAGLNSNQQLQRPDFFFANPNIGPNGLQLQETTGSDGAAAYQAQLEVHAGYVQAEAELGEAYRVTGGLRYEDGRQTVDPFDLFGGPDPITAAPIEEQYLLPAITGTYIFADGDMQFRVGASKTIARPQFRELAPSTFLDPENDRLFIGNQFLTDSELLNLDARYEWYFGSRQFLNAGVFYKDIDRPIEVIVGGSTSDIVTTFINAPRAVVYGAEFEIRKNTRLLQSTPFFRDKSILTAANYTYTKSELRIDDGDEVFPGSGAGDASPASQFFRDGQPLQGQSDYLVNAQFGWESDDEERGSQATLLLTYVSDRTSARGRPGQPDFTESPGLRLDLVMRKGFVVAGRPFRFGVEARNLTGENFEEFQDLNGRIDLNTYEIGQSISFSLSTNIGG